MLSKLSTGKIVLENLKARFITDKIIGEIEKVILKFGKDSIGLNVQIITSDGETVVNYTENSGINTSDKQKENMVILYPRNLNTGSQKYVGQNVALEGGTFNADRYISYGKLLILVEGQSKDDVVEDIQILIKGKIIEGFIVLNKKKDVGRFIRETLRRKEAVTSNTSGVSNPRFDRARRQLKKYMEKVLKDVNEECKVKEIKKIEIGEDLVNSLSEGFFDSNFKGIGKTISERIKEYMITALRKGYSFDQITNYVKTKGNIPFGRAQTIAQTEIQSMQNKVREWAYKKADPNEEQKYFWRSIPDFRRTSVCKNITNRTKKGVSLDELRKIIKEESLKGGFDGSREWTPHYSCRSIMGLHLK